MADGQAYVALCQDWLGSTQHLRIGASSLLDDIEAVLGGTAATPSATGY